TATTRLASAPGRHPPRVPQSSELLDDVDELVGLVAVRACVVEELFCFFDEDTLLGRAGDGDAAAAPELEEAFVPELAEGAEHGVGVDAENVGEVFRGREPLAGLCLAVGDCTADLAGDLLVQVE